MMYIIHNIQAFHYLHEYGISNIKMRYSPHRLVCLTHLGRKFHPISVYGVEPLLYLVEFLVGECLSPIKIEVSCTRLAIGIGIIRLACRSQHSAAVVYLRQAQFLFHGPVEVALTKKLPRLGILALGVATLYHEILYHSMEQQRVIHVQVNQPHKVVAVEWGGVIEA